MSEASAGYVTVGQMGAAIGDAVLGHVAQAMPDKWRPPLIRDGEGPWRVATQADVDSVQRELRILREFARSVTEARIRLRAGAGAMVPPLRANGELPFYLRKTMGA